MQLLVEKAANGRFFIALNLVNDHFLIVYLVQPSQN